MLSHLKRRISVITAVAVLAAGVPALTTMSPAAAAPATTAITTVTDAATYLACPASADIPSAGFTDTTSTDVDCLAYYGITQGTTATTYEPTASVPRWAMALYLTRSMSEASVTLGTGADQGFTDISGKSAEIQTAINQLKQAGVTTGTTATTYSPDDNVSRQEMAMFVERMLDTITPGPGGVSDAELVGGAATTYINSNCDAAQACTAKYNYTDIDSGTVTVEASIAIKELYQLGIHDGVSATTYNPDSDMTRAAMASFLVGALNHSNLRPAGLTIQSSTYSTIAATTPTLHVSYRDASFDPIVSTAVDVFKYRPTGLEGDRAFTTTTGVCEDAVVTTGAITGCTIDANEPATDLVGNMIPTATATSPLSQALGVAESTTYYAWTAAAATAFDNDLHSSGTTYDAISVVGNPIPADTNCSVDTPTYAATTTGTMTVHFGVTTTVTCQVTNLTNTDTYTAVPKALTVVTMNRTRVNTNLGGVASSAISDAEAVTGYTDASGSVSFTITGPADPGGGLVVANNVTDTVTITTADITAGALPASGSSGHMVESGGNVLTFLLEYKAAADVGGIVALTQTASSGLAATASITRSVSATHHDQYGDPFAASTITFSSVNHLPAGLVCTAAAPGVCTTNVAHGLAVGDDINFVSTGALRATGSTPAIAGIAVSGFTVGTVPSTTTFTLKGSDSAAVTTTTASVAATAAMASTTSFASAARTTNAAGVATYSWADTESTSGVDRVTATPAAGTAGNVNYYRLSAAADVAEVGDADPTLDASDVKYGCVEFDAVGKDYILAHYNATAAPLNATVSFMQFTYDDNDQFGNAGGAGTALDGTPISQATWVTAMATTCALGAAVTITGALESGGIKSSVANVEYGTGLSTDIVRH
ncbi:MAG: S-layer homology domain-containing protein, partial [Acidimicrobiales bacterium]|nr:S-layer homology domain-containing protein [Acidimicrobiales bacterium]